MEAVIFPSHKDYNQNSSPELAEPQIHFSEILGLSQMMVKQ